MLCYNLELAVLEKNSKALEAYASRVVQIAAQLELKSNIPVVAPHLALIQEIQSQDYWVDITLPILESMRKRIRGLVKLIEKTSSTVVYTMLEDELGTTTEVNIPIVASGVNIAQYRKRVESFIKANENHITIAKLKKGLQLTPTDLTELERFVFDAQEVESKDKFEQCFGSAISLPQFIRSLVGLDAIAVKEAFSKFLVGTTYNANQIRFVEMIMEHLTKRGVMQSSDCMSHPLVKCIMRGLMGCLMIRMQTTLLGLLRRLIRVRWLRTNKLLKGVT